MKVIILAKPEDWGNISVIIVQLSIVQCIHGCSCPLGTSLGFPRAALALTFLLRLGRCPVSTVGTKSHWYKTCFGFMKRCKILRIILIQ